MTGGTKRRTVSTAAVSGADRGGVSLPEPASFLPVPAANLHILIALGPGEKHGYALMRDIEELSDGRMRMGPGTLYGSVKRMVADGLVEETTSRTDRPLDEQRRRYYRLTPLGERVCAAELERLDALVRTAQRLVPGLGQA